MYVCTCSLATVHSFRTKPLCGTKLLQFNLCMEDLNKPANISILHKVNEDSIIYFTIFTNLQPEIGKSTQNFILRDMNWKLFTMVIRAAR